jgi:molecular chaperone GrpE
MEEKIEQAEEGLKGVDTAFGVTTEQNEAADNSSVTAEKAAPADSLSVETLKSENETLKKENSDLRDSWMRERAEFQNFKKRTAQEQMRSKQLSISRFVENLIPMIDTLDRAIAVKSEIPEVKNVVSGVEMVRNDFFSALGKESIRIVNPINEVFQPRFMEAIAMEEKEGIESEIVCEVYQSGFVLDFNDSEFHVIRPARVKVARPVRSAQTT